MCPLLSWAEPGAAVQDPRLPLLRDRLRLLGRTRHARVWQVWKPYPIPNPCRVRRQALYYSGLVTAATRANFLAPATPGERAVSWTELGVARGTYEALWGDASGIRVEGE